VRGRVHPFWLSHEEKQAWLRLLMGGQPWPELELQGSPWGARWRGERGGRGEGEGGTARWVPWRGAYCAAAALCVWLPVHAALHDVL
jgi:hypothetical protein